jgi:hypothetical protein
MRVAGPECKFDLRGAAVMMDCVSMSLWSLTRVGDGVCWSCGDSSAHGVIGASALICCGRRWPVRGDGVVASVGCQAPPGRPHGGREGGTWLRS